ncbi:MAG: glycoside hydrolase family 3 N-terminal domain-containing protein [Spirulinaceae cyanobacterium]
MPNDLKSRIGQMIVVRACGYLFDRQIRYPAWEAPNHKLKHWLQDWNVGGVILLGGGVGDLSLRTQQLQSWAQTPLFIAADIEEGVGQRFPGATWFPPPMACGGIAAKNASAGEDYAYQMGAITAKEALALGINWILAPVVDVNNNRDNPVINVRSFGETPELVGALATAFIRGTKEYPLLSTAKHFPGHGDTSTDSHLHLPSIPHRDARLSEVEIPPFQEAIAAGVDSVMSAHLLIPAWDSELPATLSPQILTQQLRDKLGFTGLVVTDALIMGGVAKFAAPEEIAVMAVAAGADVLLMPDDPEVAIEAIFKAVETGEIPLENIEASLNRIALAKEKITFSTKEIASELDNPEAEEIAKNMIKDSLVTGGCLPIPANSSSKASKRRNLIILDNALDCDFLARHTPAIAIPQQLGYQLQLIDRSLPSSELEGEQETLLQIFIRGNPFRGTAKLESSCQDLIKNLLKNNRVLGLGIYGSPYIWQWLEPHLAKDLPWVFSYGQMPLAQKVVLETLFSPLNLANSKQGAFI